MNHLKKVILERKQNDNEALNTKFEKQINDLNKNNKSKILMIVLTFIIILGALMRSVKKDDFLYWGNFKIPFIVLILFVVSYVISNYKN